MGNTLADVLKEGVYEKMRNIAESNISKKEREDIAKLSKDHFKSVEEMLEYMCHGGRVAPLSCSSICKEGYTMNELGIIVKREVVYDESHVPIGINNRQMIVEDFAKSSDFKVKNNGFIMFWVKK